VNVNIFDVVEAQHARDVEESVAPAVDHGWGNSFKSRDTPAFEHGWD
jgi:hypothetical protein